MCHPSRLVLVSSLLCAATHGQDTAAENKLGPGPPSSESAPELEEDGHGNSSMVPRLASEDLHHVYKAIDSNSNGMLSKSEIKTFWSQALAAQAKEDADRIVSAHDYANETVSLQHVIAQRATEFDAEGNPAADDGAAELFKLADFDGDGRLNETEHRAFLDPSSNQNMVDGIAAQDLKSMDVNKDGKVDVQEYAETQPLGFEDDSQQDGKAAVNAEVREKFSAMDADGNGFLSLDELKTSATSHLEDTHAITKDLFEAADANKDGDIDSGEFIHTMPEFQESHQQAHKLMQSFIMRKRQNPAPLSAVMDLSSISPLIALSLLAIMYAVRRSR